jgi:hypothetical protein
MRFVLISALCACSLRLLAQDPSHANQPLATVLPNSPSVVLTASENKSTEEIWQAALVRPQALRIDPVPEREPSQVTSRPFVLLTLAAVGATVADAESTRYGLSRGLKESNPLMGSHPSRARMYGISLPALAVVEFWSYKLKKTAPHSKRWMIPLTVTSAVHTGACVNNLIQSQH